MFCGLYWWQSQSVIQSVSQYNTVVQKEISQQWLDGLIDLFIWTFSGTKSIWAHNTLDNNQNGYMTNHYVQFHKFKRNTFQNSSVNKTEVSCYDVYSVFCHSCHIYSINLTKTKTSLLKRQVNILYLSPSDNQNKSGLFNCIKYFLKLLYTG